MKSSDIDFIIPIVSGTILMVVLLVFIIYFVLLYRKKQEEYEWGKEQAKQLLLTTKIEIKEQTMSNISRELHDNIGQMAILIKMNLSLFNYETKEDKIKVNETTDITDKLIMEIKELSTTIKGENLERFGLIDMIDKDIVRISRLDYIKILRKGEHAIPEINNETVVYLYRMTQEIFNNILQHSGSTKAILNITNKNNILTLTFKDNGKGFDLKTYKQGNGLINLEERWKIINAKLNIESQPNQGTIITISLKINKHGKTN
jgi:signal transduction histidine kinase